MDTVVFLIRNAVTLLLMAVQLAMVIRAILSWFPIDNGFVDLIYAITEPFINPIRQLFDRFGWFEGMPLDMAYIVSYLLIMIVLMILP